MAALRSRNHRTKPCSSKPPQPLTPCPPRIASNHLHLTGRTSVPSAFRKTARPSSSSAPRRLPRPAQHPNHQPLTHRPGLLRQPIPFSPRHPSCFPAKARSTRSPTPSSTAAQIGVRYIVGAQLDGALTANPICQSPLTRKLGGMGPEPRPGRQTESML